MSRADARWRLHTPSCLAKTVDGASRGRHEPGEATLVAIARPAPCRPPDRHSTLFYGPALAAAPGSGVRCG